MTREGNRESKHKIPKFKESHDEDFDWEDKLEIQNRRKKNQKKDRRKNPLSGKW